MAYARPGIINLNFKDVSSMARDMRDNDWLRNSIDIAGKTLSERDRTILYNRALAEQEGQPIPTEKTSFELMGKGYEAIKSGLSKAASKVKDAAETIVPTDMTFDGTGFVDELLGKPKLKAPFYNYEDKPIEDKPIEDKPIEDKIDNVSNDNVSNDNVMVYPSSDKNAPLKAPFYTFDPERSREDMTIKQNEGKKPVVLSNPDKMGEDIVVNSNDNKQKSGEPDNVKRTPNQLWSEMYRLNPERATYDYNVTNNAQKTDVERLKALGKDANLDDIRAMHNAYLNQKTALYNQGFDDTDPRVQTADTYIQYTGKLLADRGLLPKSEDMLVDNKFEVDPDRLNEAKTLARTAIGTAIDKNNDKVIDNAKDIREKLNDLLVNYNINPNSKEWKSIIGEWDAMRQDIEVASSEIVRKNERAQDKATQETEKKLQQEDKYEWMLVAYNDLKANPSDVSHKAYAIQAALRKESGAAIAQDEFIQSMSKLLPVDKYNAMINELGGIAGLSASLVGQKETYLSNVLARYMPYADSNKILNTYLGPKIEPYYKFKAQKKGKSTGNQTGKQSDEETIVVPTPKAKGNSSKKEEKTPDNFNLEEF